MFGRLSIRTRYNLPRSRFKPIQISWIQNFGSEGGNKEKALPTSEVWRSKSSCIFANLALEDWLYRRGGFSEKEVVLLYRNRPCVVIGRHQNPWLEANVPFLREHKIDLARRNSGGGTVYHDLGNLNVSFMSSKARHNRKANLFLLCDVVRDALGVDLEVNSRDDVMLGSKKVSGTAAKLGRDAAYHHCTLLLNVDTSFLHSALNSAGSTLIESNATPSVRCPVDNLVSDVEVNEAVTKLEETLVEKLGTVPVIEVDPCEENFPGINDLERDLRGWQWTFAKTPKFTVTCGAQEVHVTGGKVVATRHVLQKGVPDINGHNFEAGISDMLEGSWKTKMLASQLRKII